MKLRLPVSAVRRRLRGWFDRVVIADVPAEVAVCEFSCSAPTCPADWKTCLRRRHRERLEAPDEDAA